MHEVSSSIIQRAETIIVDPPKACSKQVGEVIAVPGSLEKAMELGELHADANVMKSREMKPITVSSLWLWVRRLRIWLSRRRGRWGREDRRLSHEERIVVFCILDIWLLHQPNRQKVVSHYKRLISPYRLASVVM